jgi:hypothetical protein
MSNHDERDLSAAFEELRAPASTAHYATRSPGLDVPSTRATRWPQAVAGVVAVAVAVAGAGTFLALRNARQAGSTASSGSYPQARYGATMAFDSTTGRTVMYGGSDGNGRALTDTWTWDGTTWTAAAKGPGPLQDVRMVDDPAAGGLLLVGMSVPDAPSAGGSHVCVSGGGSSGGGSVSSGSGSSAATGSSGTASAAAGGGLATAPPARTLPAGTSPTPTCPPVKPATEQTWLFTGHAWNLAATTSMESAPASGAQLAYDPTTKQVVAVSSNAFGCGPPLESAVGGAAIACPMLGTASPSGTNSSVGAMPAIRCAVADCQTLGARTWAWSGRSWKSAPAATVQAYGITLLFDDPATNHVTLMAQSGSGWSGYGLGVRCPLPVPGPKSTPVPADYAPSCPAPMPLTTTWTWTGSAWHQVSQVPDAQAQPAFAGASVAAFAGRVVVLTAGGDTWTFAAGQWTQETVAGHPSTRYGAAVGEGPSDTVLLFGGSAGGVAIANSSSGVSGSGTSTASVGSDTWVWNGTQWRQDGGRAPSPPPVPSCAAQKNGLIPPCVGPPTKVAPATGIAAPPHATPVPSPPH